MIGANKANVEQKQFKSEAAGIHPSCKAGRRKTEGVIQVPYASFPLRETHLDVAFFLEVRIELMGYGIRLNRRQVGGGGGRSSNLRWPCQKWGIAE